MKILLLLTSFIVCSQVIAETEPNNSSGTADVLVSNSATRGQIATSSNDVDWYVFTAQNGEITIKFQLDSYSLFTNNYWTVSILRASDNALVAGYEFQTKSDIQTKIFEIDQPGNYFVKVESSGFYSTNADYLITISFPQTQESPSGGLYDGIWQSNVGIFATLNQNGSELVGILLYDQSGNRWEALSGTISGSRVTLRTVYGFVNLTIVVEFTSFTTATVTQQSCSFLVSGYSCAFPNGSMFELTKLF